MSSSRISHHHAVGKHRQHLHAREGGLAALLLVVGLMRTRRWTPFSELSIPYALRPWTVKTARSMPISTPGGASCRSTFHFRLLGVLDEHLHQHLGPVLRLEAALARDDGDECVAVVELAGEPGGELEVVRSAVMSFSDAVASAPSSSSASETASSFATSSFVERSDERGVALDLIAQSGRLRHDLLRV